MRKVLSFLLALALVFSLGASAYAQTPGAELQTVACPEQGFSLQCAKDYIWKYSKTDGITIYTEHEGSIPYVLVFRAEDWLVEAAEYIEEQFTPYMKGKYGKDLVAAEEFEHFRIGGRDLAVGLYTYRLQGYLIDMVRAYDVQDRQTVVFTAKWIRGQGEATMDALTLAASQTVRDADKLDIFRVLEDRVKNTDWRHDCRAFWNLPTTTRPSSAVVDAIRHGRPVDYQNIVSLADFVLVQVGWMVSGLAYATTRRLTAERGHLAFRRDFLHQLTDDPAIDELCNLVLPVTSH